LYGYSGSIVLLVLGVPRSFSRAFRSWFHHCFFFIGGVRRSPQKPKGQNRTLTQRSGGFWVLGLQNFGFVQDDFFGWNEKVSDGKNTLPRISEGLAALLVVFRAWF
jgi:hypothetical protein